MAPEVCPVYLPDNEPYLGRPALLDFDRAIPVALKTNTKLAARTFVPGKSDLQTAACVLTPQAVSLALSIRELLRQGYLYSAVILLRPMLERLALLVYLRDHPAAVVAWRSGWERKAQPSFSALLDHLVKSNNNMVSDAERDKFAAMLHKAVHPDPAGSVWNLAGDDGHPSFASGKLLQSPDVCDFCAQFTQRVLSHTMRVAEGIFPGSDITPAS